MGLYLKAALLALSIAFPQTAYESQISGVALVPTVNAAPLEQVVEQPKAPPEREIPAILKKIAFCESSDKQFNDDGTIVRGLHNPDDVGRYQINEKIWGEKASKMGYDIYTEEGNEGMALELYKRYNTLPWIWSKQCWGK